jgi:hypothetical protein
VTAVELSTELLALAKRRAVESDVTISFAHTDMTRGRAPTCAADGVLCRGAQ